MWGTMAQWLWALGQLVLTKRSLVQIQVWTLDVVCAMHLDKAFYLHCCTELATRTDK